MMTAETKLMCGIILLTVPTIQYGGFFLLQLRSGKYSGLALTEFQKGMFRAGHAHAGVLVLLALIAEILIPGTNFSGGISWFLRICFPLAAILVSGGFFAAAAGKGVTRPTKAIRLLYLGALVLVMALVLLGIGLLL